MLTTWYQRERDAGCGARAETYVYGAAMVRVGVGVGVNGGLLCIRAVLVGGCNAMPPGAHVHWGKVV